MKLKRYIQFIKESLKEDIEEGNLWKLNEDQIRDYLTEITDAGYLVTVTFGFCEKSKYGTYLNGEWVQKEKEVFSEKTLAGDKIRPAYWIQIEESRGTTGEDLSETFQFVCSILSGESRADIEIYDRDGKLGDADSIVIKGGLYYTDTWNSNLDDEGLSEAISYIAIFAKQKDEIKITPKQLSNFYGWNVSLEKDGQLWAEMDLEDMADYMLSRSSQYKDSLVKGQEHMWDYYDISDYYPDRENLFRYELNKENQSLLIKCLIKDFGGFDKFKELIPKYSNISDVDKFKEEDELVTFLVEERFNTTIINIIKKEFEMSEEPLSEVSDTIANWNQSAHCDDNYKEILNEFDRIVGKEMSFNKVEKEVTKHWTTKDGERKEYQTEVTFYQIPYDNNWIENVDSDYLYNKDLDDLFRDWISEQSFNYEMNPRISDYGDVDSKKMNEDIKDYLDRYLNRTK
jgi:hypothetical protein